MEPYSVLDYLPFVLLSFIFLLLSLLHLYWLLGGKWASTDVIPILDGEKQLNAPGPVPTLMVAFGLAIFALFYFYNLPNLSIPWSPLVNNVVQWIVPSIFLIRAIGDFNYVGLFKKKRVTGFAKMDSKYYSPLCLLIAILGYLSIWI